MADNKRTITVRDDIPDALRDSLIRQLEGSPPLLVGNLADLQRAGAAAVASGGPTEVYRVGGDLDDDEAKKGAQRVLDEEKAAKEPEPAGEDTGEEPLNEKDPAVVKASQDREAEFGGAARATTTTTPKAKPGA